MNQKVDTDNIENYFGEFDKNQQLTWCDIGLQHQSSNAEAHCFTPPHRVVPVIFLPGIMGSNLKSTIDNRSIWRIRAGIVGKFIDAIGWAMTSANARKKLLDPNKTETDFTQKVDNNNNESMYFAASRQERGWGSALATSYFAPLEKLQKELLCWEDYYNKAKKAKEYSCCEADAFFKNESIFEKILNKALSPDDKAFLSIEETRNYRSVLLPLHVFGYNWLQDNALSAQQLSDYIDVVLAMYDVDKNGGKGHGLAFEKGHEKVIIVTHSMGGLVARYASELLKQPCKNKILGIVHGVMPDLGSPTTYKMMKIGEHSFPMSMVVGASAKRLMSVLAQSPAPMQLLPSAKYNNGQPWLRIEKGSLDGITDLYLPKKSTLLHTCNPFKDIYLKRKVWWQMYEPDILDTDNSTIEANFEQFAYIIVQTVKPFIQEIDGHYHSNTYLFYGGYFNENAPNDSRRSDETITWKLQNNTSWLWVSDDSRETTEYGTQRAYTLLKSSNKWTYTNSGKNEGGCGDGTVPLGAINFKDQDKHYKEILKTNVGHQDAFQYKSWDGDGEYGAGKISPAIKFTLRSICRLLDIVEVKPK
ncbi:lipase family alpha/beta hydrolase [Proteus mirabilis]|uniref:lipase family alpha/beta hydrolase n=1 Tax=Proteus mirabilis TaxID=584 RepID=UPI002362A609|nr:hypothetical protein [Proteus mirabilis]MDC9769039.1 hypothetical protein [Proteus mirabilis]